MSRKTYEKAAIDDLFFSLVLMAIGLYATHKNWLESDWWGFLGTALLTLFGGFWLAVRIYHLTHKDEVFGEEDEN